MGWLGLPLTRSYPASMFVCVLIWLVDNNTMVIVPHCQVLFNLFLFYLISRREVGLLPSPTQHFFTNGTFWVCEMEEEPGNKSTIVRLLTQHTIVRL